MRGGAGTALVGDPDTIVERMMEYADLGVETFIFSGYPHLEEAYRTAELLFPKLPKEFFVPNDLAENSDEAGHEIEYEFGHRQPRPSTPVVKQLTRPVALPQYAPVR